MLSSTYLLIAVEKIDFPFNLELDSGLPFKVFKGCMVVIGLTNNGGDIRALSNAFTLSFRIAFSFYMSPIEKFKASPVASWNSMTLEGGTR